MCTKIGMLAYSRDLGRPYQSIIPYACGIHSAGLRNPFRTHAEYEVGTRKDCGRCGIPENSTHGFMYSCYCIHWLFVIPESVHTPCPLFLKVYTNIQIIAQMTGDKHERRPPS